MGYPSIFPTGTTVYDKEKAFNGYTVFPSAKGALLIDMNGREVQLWAGLGGFPNKILPGGYVMGTTGTRPGKKAYQDQIDLVQVDWEGNILWSWRASDHFEQFGFDEAARNALFRNPCLQGEAGGDWMHINSMSVLGENKWYDQGDERFHPENIIIDGRNSNILAIISKKTGDIVWKLGPDFNESEATKKLGWIIGQHHLHMIPKGLPGEGDLLVFDNGGEGGYGVPNPGDRKSVV